MEQVGPHILLLVAAVRAKMSSKDACSLSVRRDVIEALAGDVDSVGRLLA